jgi:hypothetical protein
MFLRNVIRDLTFVLIVLAPIGGYAQDASQAPVAPQFFPRFDFSLSLATLSSPDPRFSYDGRVNTDFDVVDYGKGRTTIYAQYEVFLGNQLRLLDPNQGNYTFEGSSSLRAHGSEFAVVFHHLSRHLSDRQNFESISYNALGGRVMRHFDLDKTTVDVRGDIAKVVRHEFLDYTWTGDLHLMARRGIRPSYGVFGLGEVETYGVNPAIANRAQQNGGRVEVGVYLNGKRAHVELFGGWEQLVDAYPLERGSKRLPLIGLRVSGR